MVSVRAKLATWLVACSRVLSSVLLLVVLVTVARLVFLGEGEAPGSPSSPSPAQWTLLVAGGAGAAFFAFLEKAAGGLSARAEERRLRERLLRTMFALGPEGFGEDEADKALAVNMMTEGVERFTEYRQTYLGSTLAALVTPFIVIAYVGVTIDWVTGLILLGLFVLAPLLVGGFMSAFRKTSSESRKERERLSGGYLDALRNLEIVSLTVAGKRIQEQLKAAGERNRLAIMRLLARNQVVIIVMDGAFSLLLICAAAIAVIWRNGQGAITPVDALTVMLLTALLIEPLSQVAGFFYVGMGGLAAGRRIRRYLARTLVSGGAAASREAPGAATPTQHGDPTAALEARNVHFDYGRGEVLHGVDLRVPVGGRIGLVGASGQGKSTLLKLLRGVATPVAGSITVGGVDLAQLPLAERAQQVATVNQSTWLFTGTVADNLRLASPEATEEEMWGALRQANLADAVARMGEGLNSDVGERGALLSGGEGQRLSLARALLSGRRLLVMDEPTSQVDATSEDLIARCVEGLDSKWTVLVATHRPRLLERLDRVWNMRGGELVGTDDE